MTQNQNQVNREQEDGGGSNDPWDIRSFYLLPLIILFLALCLSGCSLIPSSTQRPFIFNQAIAFATADAQNALSGAQSATPPDTLGITCHQAFLAWLQGLQFPVVKVTGVASAGEAVRLHQRAIVEAKAGWQGVADACAPVFPAGAQADRLLRLLRP